MRRKFNEPKSAKKRQTKKKLNAQKCTHKKEDKKTSRNLKYEEYIVK